MFDDFQLYDSALAYFHKVLINYSDVLELVDYARIYLGIGKIYYNLEKDDISFEYYKKSLEIYKRLNKEKQISTVIGNIGLLHMYNDRLKEAEQYFKQAIEILENTDYTKEKYRSILWLGFVYKQTKEYDKSLVYLEKALDYFKKNGIDARVRECYEYLYDLYSKKGDHINELRYLKLLYETEKELMERHSEGFVNSTIAKVNSDKELKIQQYQSQLAEKTIETQNIILVGSLIVVFLSVVFAILLYKTNKKIEKKNSELEHLTKTQSKIHDMLISELNAKYMDLMTGVMENQNQKDILDKINKFSKEYNKMLREFG